MKETSFPELAKILKSLLKERGLTYRDLAEALGLSESNVKKIFTSEDCSLARLNSICVILEVSLSDLMQEASKVAAREFHFTLAQEEFLVKHRQHFLVYWKLVYEEWSQAEVKKFLGLNQDELFKILRALDQHKLLELLPGGEVRCPDMAMVIWASRGPLVNMVRTRWAPEIMRLVVENKTKPKHSLSVRFFLLKPDTLREFVKAVDDLQIEFGRRSLREHRFYRKETIPVSMTTAFLPECIVDRV